MGSEPPFISEAGWPLTALIELCQELGTDPYLIMADELRAMGWTVEEPNAR